MFWGLGFGLEFAGSMRLLRPGRGLAGVCLPMVLIVSTRYLKELLLNFHLEYTLCVFLLVVVAAAAAGVVVVGVGVGVVVVGNGKGFL